MNNVTQDILDLVSKNIKKNDYEFVVTTAKCLELQLKKELNAEANQLFLVQSDEQGNVKDYYKLKVN